jgi:hypothetical protein
LSRAENSLLRQTALAAEVRFSKHPGRMISFRSEIAQTFARASQ